MHFLDRTLRNILHFFIILFTFCLLFLPALNFSLGNIPDYSWYCYRLLFVNVTQEMTPVKNGVGSDPVKQNNPYSCLESQWIFLAAEYQELSTFHKNILFAYTFFHANPILTAHSFWQTIGWEMLTPHNTSSFIAKNTLVSCDWKKLGTYNLLSPLPSPVLTMRHYQLLR